MQGSDYYLNKFLRRKSSIDLLIWELFPNTKEITETVGAVTAIQNHLELELKDPTVNVYVVGDGVSPRTGGYLAVNSNWNIWSIDPLMRISRYKDKGIRRLTMIDKRIEDCDGFATNGPAIILHVHSHADLNHSYRKIKSPNWNCIAIPCCSPQYLKGIPHHIEYDDKHIHSPKNLVKIWKNLNNT